MLQPLGQKFSAGLERLRGAAFEQQDRSRLARSLNKFDGSPQLCLAARGSRDPLVSAENQLGGASANHVGRRVGARPGNDARHHGSIRHS